MKPFFTKLCSLLLCALLAAGMVSPAVAALSTGVSAAGAGAQTLRVAFYPLTGFFEYDEQGKEVGYGVELLDKISMYTGLRFQYVPTESWESTKQMLLDGEADIRMPGNLPATPSETLDYTEQSVLDTYYAVMALKSRTDLFYQDYEAFARMKVGVSRSLYEYAQLGPELEAVGIAESELVFFEDHNSCRAALASGEIDALVSNIMDLDGEMKQLERFSTVSNYISMLLGSPDLDTINSALSSIKLNEPTFLSELYKKWFPDRASIPLTKSETDYLTALDSLCFSFQDGQGYLSRKQEDGSFTGFYPAVAQLVCEMLGLKYEETDRADDKKDGIVIYPDFYYDFVWAAEREADITQPYIKINYYEITRKNHSSGVLEGRVAAVQKFRVTQDVFAYGARPASAVWCEDYEACIEAVAGGRADFTYVNNYAAEYYLSLYRYSGLSSSLTDISHQACFGVWGDSTGLLASALGKLLSTISSETLNTLMIENTAQQPEQELLVEWAYENPLRSICLVSGVVVLLVVVLALALYTKRARKKNEALLKATNAKQDFLSRMSHDMRTPMNAIIGFSAFGQECGTLEEARAYHGKIHQSGTYLLQLINDSLEMNKLQSGKYALRMEPYWNTEFVDALYNILQPKAQEKGIAFSIRSDVTEPIALFFDKIRIQQIFVNLLNNALKFTPQGGHVSLDISHEQVREDVYLVHFCVSDNGIGMSEDYLQNGLFKPFEQEHLNVSEEGTGLGLAIVKDLVDAMGGTIRCESVRDQGTTFRVDIEGRRAPNAAPAQPVRRQSHAQLNGRRVLVCEDHPLNREIVVKLLEKAGMQVDTAADGQEGVARFSQSPENNYFAVLMDIRMPVMDGLAAARAIRALERGDARTVPIIALSANAFEEDVNACREAGMNDHLSKPIDPPRLYEMLLQFVHI